MKNVNFLRSAGFLSIALTMVGSFFFFTSATTLDDVDSQSIAKISAEIAKVDAELTALKVAKKASFFGDPTLGQIEMFAGNFDPRGWALCNGQLLPISQNDALFSLLGTTYGGDGRTTFALPDLRGRVPVHFGEGPGLHEHHIGYKFGVEYTDIKTSKAPATLSTSGNQVNIISDFRDRVDVRQPSLGINFIIALTGRYPSRS